MNKYPHAEECPSISDNVLKPVQTPSRKMRRRRRRGSLSVGDGGGGVLQIIVVVTHRHGGGGSNRHFRLFLNDLSQGRSSRLDRRAVGGPWSKISQI